MENDWLATLGNTWLGFNLANRTNDMFTDWMIPNGSRPNMIETSGHVQLTKKYGPGDVIGHGWSVTNGIGFAFSPTTCYLPLLSKFPSLGEFPSLGKFEIFVIIFVIVFFIAAHSQHHKQKIGMVGYEIIGSLVAWVAIGSMAVFILCKKKSSVPIFDSREDNDIVLSNSVV